MAGQVSSDATCHGAHSSLRETLIAAFHEIAKSESWDPSRSCVILSGGLDSSIVAQVGGPILGLRAAFTVLATPACTDRPFAHSVAAAAGLEHHVLDVGLPELLEELPTCVRELQTFDPMSLRNSIAVCRALREAARLGFTCAVTGDAADELFGGYNFTHRLEDGAWLEHRNKMARTMEFSSIPLGRHFGLHVTSPFLQPSVVSAALALGKADCVGTHEGGLMGKMPLRLAFSEVLTCWRAKDPIEVGCGTTELGDRPWLPGAPPGYFHASYPPQEFVRLQALATEEDGVDIRDPEHLHYYQVFRQVFPGGQVPGKPRDGSDPCPKCRYQLSHPEQCFCVTCGHYDPRLRSKPEGAAAVAAAGEPHVEAA